MNLSDTIVAISSPGGYGVRGILRLSGPNAWELAQSVLVPHATKMLPRRWIDVQLEPWGVRSGLLLFKGPQSFTGQDIAELHVPGQPVLLAHLQSRLEAAGARWAEAGEFSFRAWHFGKLDVSEAEGINATIHAGNQRQLAAAAALRNGELFKWATGMSDSIADLLAWVEAGIDFSDEPDVGIIQADEIKGDIQALQGKLAELLSHTDRWERLDRLPAAVLMGEPNVGKSSLFNALLGRDRAIVSNVAGTTRDTISGMCETAAGTVQIVDTPGLEHSDEALGIHMNQARETAAGEADVLILVSDTAAADHLPQLPAPVIRVRSKCDLQPTADHVGWHSASARTGVGIDALRENVGRMAYQRPAGAEQRMALNQRHVALLGNAHTALTNAENVAAQWQNAPEILAVELRSALDIIGQITGRVSRDDILGRIFSHFCIGK